MSLGAALVAELPFLRQQAESLMLDTFTVYAPNGTTTDVDGMEVPAYEVQGATPGKIQSRTGGIGNGGDTNTRTETVGGVGRPVVDSGLHIPVTAPAPEFGSRGTGWEYVLTTPGPATPPDLVGSRWLVVDAPSKSHMTARRLDVVRLP